jgi:endo-1,4-beta-mannosidase
MVLAIEVSQLVQLVVEHVSLENPQFPTMQSTPIFKYFTKNLKEINMFFEQATHNATTWLGILEGLTNLSVECEKTKHNLYETNNQLQTHSIELTTMQQTLKNHKKELATIKVQFIKV